MNEYNEYKRLEAQRWKGFLDKIKGGTFIKYSKEQLKNNIGNDVKDKFNGTNFSANNEIEKNVSNTIGELSIKSKEKDINSVSDYIIFGRENTSKSNLL